MRTRVLITLALLGALPTNLPAVQAGSDNQASESVPSGAPIPEPLLFDMVLPLGAEQGEVEVNSIFRLPVDGETLIWIPEIEGAVLSGFTFELEIEMLGNRQKGWNVASQATLGRGFDNHFIHGAQVRVERDDDEGSTEFVALCVSSGRRRRRGRN